MIIKAIEIRDRNTFIPAVVIRMVPANEAQRYLMVPQIFAAMIIIGVLGMSTDLLMGAFHRRLFSWTERGAQS